MEKKKRDYALLSKFNSSDVQKWKDKAELETRGNLTLWIETTLNNAVNKQIDLKVLTKQRKELLEAERDLWSWKMSKDEMAKWEEVKLKLTEVEQLIFEKI